MRLFLLYIKGHAKTLLLSLFFIAVFAVVTLMYGYPPEPVLYASCICVYLGAMLCILSFFRFRRRHRVLQKLKESIVVNTEALPVPRGVLEEDSTGIDPADRAGNQPPGNADIRGTARERRLLYDVDTPDQNADRRHAPALADRGDRGERRAFGGAFKIEEYVGMALGYVRSESLSADLVLRRCALDDIIRQAVRKYAQIFIAEKISLSFEGTGVQVVTDEKWLLFVLEQLLSNALKYTKQGSISIYMAASEPKTLVIEDTGIGIRAEDVPRVFERGYTGYNGREYTRSTGIGLYLCRRILTKLGHTIAVESEVGRGTRPA